MDYSSKFEQEIGRSARAGDKTRGVVDVDKIKTDRGLADACLARTGFAELDLFPGHNLRSAGFVESYCLRHLRSSLLSTACRSPHLTPIHFGLGHDRCEARARNPSPVSLLNLHEHEILVLAEYPHDLTLGQGE